MSIIRSSRLPNQKPMMGEFPNLLHHSRQGLVGQWLFNEGSGDTVFDSSGNENHGTFFNNSYWETSLRGHSGRVEGTDDYIDIFNSVTVPTEYQSLGTDLTIICVVQPNALKTADTGSGWRPDSTFIELRQEIAAINNVPFSLGILSNKFAFGLSSQGLTLDEIHTFDGQDMSVGEVWHCAGTVLGNSMVLYLNGVGESKTISVATGDRSVGSTTSNMQFGLRSLDAGDKTRNEYDGKFISIKIYNRALTPSEIQADYIDSYADFRFGPIIAGIESGGAPPATNEGAAVYHYFRQMGVYS